MGTNTGIGIGIGIPFKNNALGGDRPYLPPELKARLIGVWDNYGKKNTDADRNIIKNKIPNAGGDLEILNSAYRLNSGFGGYSNDFQEYTYSENVVVKDNTNAIFNSRGKLLVPYSYLTKDIPSFKIKVSGLSNTYHFRYYYRDSNGVQHSVDMAKDGNYELPICYNVQSSSDGTDCGFANYGSDIVSVEILPKYEGAFVTDGVNDMIVSQNPVSEMLGGSNEITVVSMMANLDSREILCNSNFSNVNGYNVRNTLEPNGVISMLGYTDKNGTTNNLNLIMGDKDSIKLTDKVNFNSDYVFYPAQYYKSYYQVAWYWTFIANKVLTTDEINQVIAYFNLDRTLNPDILCNTIKQGITNENHAEFGDKLIDFSGNGRDIQLNNIAWDGDSGIGKYNYPNWKATATIANTYSTIVNYPTVNGTYSINVNGVSELMQSIGLHLEIKYTTSTGIIYIDIKQDGVYSYILPDGATDLTLRFGGIPGIVNEPCNITITQIPSHAGALCLNGVNDFGQFVGDLGLKDYTLIMNRAYNNLINNQVPLISSNIVEDQTPFIVEHWNTGSNAISFSYGASRTTDIPLDINKKIVYQSTYSYMGYVIPKGNAISTGNGITLGKFGNGIQYSAICLWSLMLFPYSMSEFLIERQLKKHKLGTLYPDMVEFRPVIKSNASYDNIVFYYKNEKVENGTYLTVGSSIGMHIRLSSNPVNEIKSITVNGIPATFKFHDANNNIYQYDFNLTSKSPQKIDITIDEYIRYEDIVQPYPVLLRFNDENGNEVSWGGKFKVGSTITRIGSAADSNLLPNIYNIFGLLLNDNQVTSSKVIVEKTMVFKAKSTYIFDNNEPKCILSPSRLRIPNSSYKILGYIPDISGHGNNGVIHNSAYAEGSGVNEDGSYQFDGVDDFVTIPTLSSGGKQVLMKVNWNTINSIIYDQRGSGGFAIYCSDYNNPSDSIIVPAYRGRNTNGTTYIDGIRNEYITASQLRNVTHNIVEILDTSYAAGKTNPIIGKSYMNSNYGSLALYDFMLFDEISTDDKIKELNEYVGIEGNTEWRKTE